MGVTEQGLASIVKTRGNKDVHVILRGGSSGPNFSSEYVKKAAVSIAKARPGYHPAVMIDCSRTFCLSFLALDPNGRIKRWKFTKEPQQPTACS